jgi:D-galacturonate reductase
MTLQVAIIGGGMIAERQILPSVYHLRRLGLVGDVTVCARHSTSLRELAASASVRAAFPGQSFRAYPPLDADPSEAHPDAYQRVVAQLPPHQLVIVATPETSHFEITRFALEHGQHVLAVKPFVMTYREHAELQRLAEERGLWVGIEYHKRFDHRSLEARWRHREGRFGAFRCGEAKLIEPFYYRSSNFQNWFTKDATVPFTYVGCHYVDLTCFITGLRPVEVSVRGVEGKFPNGNDGYLWTASRVVFENGGVLSLINGLGYPDAAAGSNDQGMTLFFESEDGGGGAGGAGGAMIHHADQYRGVQHCYLPSRTVGAKGFAFVNPDFFRLLPWEGDGLKPVGYGYESIEANVLAVRRVNEAGRSGGDAVRAIVEQGLIATPWGTVGNTLVTEAGRLSIGNGGRNVRILYAPEPRVQLA